MGLRVAAIAKESSCSWDAAPANNRPRYEILVVLELHFDVFACIRKFKTAFIQMHIVAGLSNTFPGGVGQEEMHGPCVGSVNKSNA
jgi:hypothetical protein